MSKTLRQMPCGSGFMKSTYELDEIRGRVTGIFEHKIKVPQEQLALLELILCLANEISDLKKKCNHQWEQQ